MSNSKLVNYTRISPNSTNPRKEKIKKITIHHMAGNLSVEACGNVFASSSRDASSNYGIDSNGQVGMYVEEKNRSWCSSSASNDHQAVTIEVANNSGAPNWTVSDKALSKLIDLCTDICERNGIKELNYTGDASGNLTMHCWFVATSCPGPYLKSKFTYIADEVNKRLVATSNATPSSTLYRVQVGAYKDKSNAESMERKLKSKGFDTYLVAANGLYKVQTGAYSKKQNAENQAKKLKLLGFDTYITTNGGSPITSSPKKSIETIAREVVRGDWGNGAQRKEKLTAAGYDYDEVQAKVNELL